MISLINQAFQNAKNEKRPALLTYTVAGDNTKKKSLEILKSISNYADICELGFPHNTPIADGGQIQTSAYLAIKNGIKINDVFSIVKNFKKLKKNYFDTILYLDVIEHIKKDKEEIINAYKLLKSNGTLIICVPAFQFLYSLYDKKIGHFRRYSQRDFKKLLHDCNIKNYKMRYFDFLGFCLIFLSNFLTKDNLNNFSTKIKFWNYLIPISALIDTLFMKYFFGKSLLVKIKKN